MARPWIGNGWGQPENALGGLRLMILGESHYHREAPVRADVPDMTEGVINAQVEDGSSYPFLSKIEQLVMTGQEPRNTQDFWDSVIFYNYIPVVAANNPRQRPPDDLWYGDAPRLFNELVRKMKVEAILVCGTTLWRRMPTGLVERQNAYEAGSRSWREREYEVALPYRAVAAHIPHPSGWGWSYTRCEPVLQHLRRRVNDIRQELGVAPVV